MMAGGPVFLHALAEYFADQFPSLTQAFPLIMKRLPTIGDRPTCSDLEHTFARHALARTRWVASSVYAHFARLLCRHNLLATTSSGTRRSSPMSDSWTAFTSRP